MSHFITALRQVIEADLRRLNELEARLQEARGPVIAGVVRSIGETCDSLSAGLVKLARNTNTVSTSETTPPMPVKDPRGLEIAARLKCLIENGPCERCGGVSRASE